MTAAASPSEPGATVSPVRPLTARLSLLVAVVVGAYGAVRLARGDVSTGITGLAFAGAVLATRQAMRPGKGTPRATADGALLLPYAPPWRPLVTVSGVLYVVAYASIAIGASSGSTRAFGVLGAAVFGVATAGALGRDEGILLRPDGVRFGTTRLARTVRWEAVKPSRVALRGGFAVDEETVGRVVTYYRAHPESRHELADGSAVERVARNDLA